MVSFTSTATFTLIAFAALIEPSIQGSSLLTVGGKILGGVISGSASSNNNNQRRESLAADLKVSGVPEDIFHECLNTVKTQPPRLFVNHKDKTAKLTNVPDICITAANRFNQLPNITAIEKTEGKITVKGKELHLSGVEGQVQQLLEKSSNKSNTKDGNKDAHKGTKSASAHASGATHGSHASAQPTAQ